MNRIEKERIEGSRGKATKAEVDCREKGGEEKVREMEEEARRKMTKRVWRKSKMLKEIP